MSSRVLKKLGLHAEKELNCLPGDDGTDTEADFSSSSSSKKKHLNINRYDLLNQQSHSESEVKEDDDHETAGSLNAHDGVIDLKESRRKKKKKKKKACKAHPTTRSSEDNVEDEVDRSIREVNEMLGEAPFERVAPTSSVSPSTRGKKNILSLDYRCLNPNNEIRRIFGSKILQNEQKKRGRVRAHLKVGSLVLVTPKANWPLAGKSGISMKLVETRNGLNYFAFEHSPSYQQIQMKFLDAVERLDSQFIVETINTYSYHIDSLLHMSSLCQLSDNLSMAAELIQRALFYLECAFHPTFNLATGLSRLDYRHQVNRSFYVALFKHMSFVGSRACYRTALEFSKLILSLDPEEDPLAIVLTVDFYALRSQEYDWFIRLANEWESTKNLSQLPNFAYSLAVAYFQLGEVETAHELLQKAVIKFPGVLLKLMDKCCVQVDQRVSASPYFRDAHDRQSKSLTQLELLYVARSYHVWRESELLPWLENNVNRALERIQAGDPLVAEWEVNRNRRYATSPLNVLRHVILSEIEEIPLTSPNLPSTIIHYDLLPPPDSINTYNRPVRSQTSGSQNGTLAVFLRSLIPNFRANQLPELELADDDDLRIREIEAAAQLGLIADEGENATGGGGGADLDIRRSVASLIDAMRDLLNNFHLPDVQLEGDIDDDEDDDDQNSNENSS